MICKIISMTALLFLLLQTVAYSEEQSSLYLVPDYIAINFGINSYGRTLNENSNYEDNISISDYVIGVDFLTSLQFSKLKFKSHYFWGPWIGGDIGLLNINHQASYLYGLLNVGWAIGYSIKGIYECCLGVGLGVSYAYMDNDRYQLVQNASAGVVGIVVMGLWPFYESGNFIKSLGFSLRIKVLPFLPKVKEVSGGDSFSQSGGNFSLGVVYKF